jgi:hypothetical protein
MPLLTELFHCLMINYKDDAPTALKNFQRHFFWTNFFDGRKVKNMKTDGLQNKPSINCRRHHAHTTDTDIECDSLLENLQHCHGGGLVTVFCHLLCWQSYSACVSIHILSWQLCIVHGMVLSSLPSGLVFFQRSITRKIGVAYGSSRRVAGCSYFFMETEKEKMPPNTRPCCKFSSFICPVFFASVARYSLPLSALLFPL